MNVNWTNVYTKTILIIKVKARKALLVVAGLLVLNACGDTVKDDETPRIDITIENAFPVNCASVYRGESFEYRFRLTDNIALGSYSIELHHNFDHHTHSTSPVQCAKEPVKAAVNPLVYIDQFSIEAQKKEFIATGEIFIPANVDTGDYHLMIRVTDASGWQNFEGISLKVVDRP